MSFQPEPKNLELPPKEVKPNPYMERNADGSFVHPMNTHGEEEQEEMDICEDCICPVTCQSFERCIYKES